MSQNMSPISAAESPVRPRSTDPVSRAKARLWQAVWEAGGRLSEDEIREFVEGVLAECRADQP